MYVRYNGGKDGYYSYSDPKTLVKGQIYKVSKICVDRFDTKVILEGIEGRFNSIWFDQLPTFFAFSKETPRLGYRLYLTRFEVLKKANGEMATFPRKQLTTHVRVVDYLGSNTYQMITANTCYIVQVLDI
ncbi:MAG: hypothetical protein IKG56_02770 [Clostridia bacterium]|nr:hypothetical protein [Clostridia bacterium]